MSALLKTCFETILKMPYYRNDAASSKKSKLNHEDELLKIFVSNQFSVIYNEKIQKNKKVYNFSKKDFKNFKIYNNLDDISLIANLLPNGSIMPQPVNSQSYPDFLVKDIDGRLVVVEAKSFTGKSIGIGLNDNFICGHGVYILSSEFYNSTTFFKGTDVISPELIKEFLDIERETEKYNKTLKDRISKITNNPGHMGVRMRKQFSMDLDAFSNPNKTVLENNVIDFVS